MYQVKLTLTPDEYRALLDVALMELRNVPDQARYFIRQALLEQGRIRADDLPNVSKYHPQSRKEVNS